ncbi:MAG: D-alanyl-D-alanine carboxypeptidase [Clostridia bacterium]|nr:D-alanyl-D-alanine carboxypeptidase [Clostridia bacterium]
MKNKFLVFVVCVLAIFCFFPFAKASASQIEILSKSALLMSADSGEILYQYNADEKRPIASMVKIMTLLLCFDSIADKKISFDDMVTISERASSMGGSQAFLDAGSQYKVDDLLKSIAISSANDSCVAMAEHISGSVEDFVNLMNKKANQLQMNDTVFVNCTGLPVAGQFSTANDVAKMFGELIKYDDYFKYTSIWMDDFVHPGGRVTGLTNTNKLIRQYNGCDAGKTGYTSEAKHCLAATAKRNDMRLISVIVGGPDSKTRFEENKKLFDFGFANYQNKVFLKKGEVLEQKATVFGGKNKELSGFVKDNLTLFGKKGDNKGELQTEYFENIKAPVKKGDIIGKAFIKNQGEILAQTDILCAIDVQKAGFVDNFNEIISSW